MDQYLESSQHERDVFVDYLNNASPYIEFKFHEGRMAAITQVPFESRELFISTVTGMMATALMSLVSKGT
jgi:hypothetical protein